MNMIDLAAERLGGKVIAASDEFFAEKENLIKLGRGIFVAEKFTDRGKWMDGWETRRRRTPGFDWAIVKLGCPGIVRSVDIDTNHFLGNHPPFASLEVCSLDNDKDLASSTEWVEVLPQSPLEPGSQNVFTITSDARPAKGWTHVRLKIYPDGGVARLRIYGDVVKDWSAVKGGEIVDLAAVVNGGKAVAASDIFFSPMDNLLMPGKSTHMGDGWETRRRRGPGNDWVIVRLGSAGQVKKAEIDTSHFKGNFPESCSIDACYEPQATPTALTAGTKVTWYEMLPRQKLTADAVHAFESEIVSKGQVTHLRLNIFPDGGVARLRIWGQITK